MTKKIFNLNQRNSQLFVRCPDALKKAIGLSANKSARSMAAEVIIRLTKSLEDYDYIPKISES